MLKMDRLSDLSRVDNPQLVKLIQAADRKLVERLNELDLPVRLRPVGSDRPAPLNYRSQWQLTWWPDFNKIVVHQKSSRLVTGLAGESVALIPPSGSVAWRFSAKALEATRDVVSAFKFLAARFLSATVQEIPGGQIEKRVAFCSARGWYDFRS